MTVHGFCGTCGSVVYQIFITTSSSVVLFKLSVLYFADTIHKPMVKVTSFIFQIITVQRQVFDFLGFMWLPIIANFTNILLIIFGSFGAVQYITKYLLAVSIAITYMAYFGPTFTMHGCYVTQVWYSSDHVRIFKGIAHIELFSVARTGNKNSYTCI